MVPAKEKCSPYSIDVIPHLNESAIEIIKILLDEEVRSKNADIAKLINKEEKKERLNHSLLLAQLGLVVKEVLSRGDVNKSFLCVARRNGKVVGVSLAGLNEDNKSVGFFTGVTWESRRQGISTELTRIRLIELKKREINEYDLEMWEGSLAVAKKLENEGLIEIIHDKRDPKSFRIKIRTQN